MPSSETAKYKVEKQKHTHTTHQWLCRKPGLFVHLYAYVRKNIAIIDTKVKGHFVQNPDQLHLEGLSLYSSLPIQEKINYSTDRSQDYCKNHYEYLLYTGHTKWARSISPLLFSIRQNFHYM